MKPKKEYKSDRGQLARQRKATPQGKNADASSGADKVVYPFNQQTLRPQ